jgi:hypothetical protein
VKVARRVRRAAWETDQQQCRHRAPGRLHTAGGERTIMQHLGSTAVALRYEA